MSLHAGIVISIAIIAAALSLSVLLSRHSRSVSHQRHQPELTISAPATNNHLSVSLVAHSEDHRTFRRISLELIEPTPDARDTGFGSAGATTKSCSAGPLPPGREVVFPQLLILTHNRGSVRVKVKIRQGLTSWCDIREVSTQ